MPTEPQTVLTLPRQHVAGSLSVTLTGPDLDLSELSYLVRVVSAILGEHGRHANGQATRLATDDGTAAAVDGLFQQAKAVKVTTPTEAKGTGTP